MAISLVGRQQIRASDRARQNIVYVDGRMVTHPGIGRHIFEHLKGLHQAGAALSVTYLDDDGKQKIQKASPTAELFHSKAKVYGFKERFGRNLGISAFLDRPDVFWFPQYNVPWILPYPSIVTVHDLIQFRYNRSISGGWARLQAAQAVLKNALKQAARIVCVSHSTEHDLVEMDGSLSKRIKVVENGVGPQWSVQSLRGHQRVKDIVGNSPFLFSVSTKKPHKNQYLLLELMDQLGPSCEHHLILAGLGTPEWERRIRAWRSQSKFADRVHDLPFIDEQLLASLYQRASAFLFPSLYEGFGLPPLEAMAAGCPTVVSSRGALPQVVGDAGMVIDPLNLTEWADSVTSILSDQQLASEMKRKGRMRAEEYSWKRRTEKLLGVFEEVI